MVEQGPDLRDEGRETGYYWVCEADEFWCVAYFDGEYGCWLLPGKTMWRELPDDWVADQKRLTR